MYTKSNVQKRSLATRIENSLENFDTVKRMKELHLERHKEERSTSLKEIEGR
jgi:hypothetical protein